VSCTVHPEKKKEPKIFSDPLKTREKIHQLLRKREESQYLENFTGNENSEA